MIAETTNSVTGPETTPPRTNNQQPRGDTLDIGNRAVPPRTPIATIDHTAYSEPEYLLPPSPPSRGADGFLRTYDYLTTFMKRETPSVCSPD